MNDLIHILMIEDSEDDALQLARILKRDGWQFEYERVETEENFLRALWAKNWDLIFSDYFLPSFSSLRALQIIREKEIEIPFIVISGAIGENLAVEMMQQGANDYFVKGNITRLGETIRRELGVFKNRREHKLLIKFKEDLGAIIVHELRGPLAAIKMGIEHLSDEFADPLTKNQKDIVSILGRKIFAASKLINNILSWSRLTSSNIKPHFQLVDIMDLLNEVQDDFKPVFANQNIELHEDIDTGVTTLSCDREMIKQVLVNLVENAVKFAKTFVKIKVGNLKESGQIKITISDDGKGISKEDQQNIFKFFYTASNQPHQKKYSPGTGLGLGLCQTIISLHKGVIGVESTPGEGSHFYFMLPNTVPDLKTSRSTDSH